MQLDFLVLFELSFNSYPIYIYKLTFIIYKIELLGKHLDSNNAGRQSPVGDEAIKRFNHVPRERAVFNPEKLVRKSVGDTRCSILCTIFADHSSIFCVHFLSGETIQIADCYILEWSRNQYEARSTLWHYKAHLLANPTIGLHLFPDCYFE